MFNLQNVIEIERQARKSGGPRLVYKIKCKNEKCSNIIKIRKTEVKEGNRTYLCGPCSHKKKPFESIYNWIGIKNGRDVLITYADFLEYTKITECHYCCSEINWNPFGTVNGKFISRAYFLDRKDSNLPYIKENIVVCCTRCNRSKNNRFSYDEWYGMTEYFRNKLSKDVTIKHVGQVFIEGGDVCSLKGGSCNS